MDNKKALRVEKWDRFEESIVNDKKYNNPYTDVDLITSFTRPDGTTIKFWGFYDGAATWKFRFMPDQLGTWSYEAKFSDSTASKCGTFKCVPSDIPGMISKYEPNPIWFGYKNGNAAVIRSFHVGDCFFSANLTIAERKKFLDWAQQQGYNMLSVASHYLNRSVEGRGLGWDTPDLYPLNAAEYNRLERIIDELAKRKIIIYPFAGFFGQSSNFPLDHGEQEIYIKYTLARLGPYWNIVFNVAGPEPILKPDKFHNAMTMDDINRIGSLIKEYDVFDHLLSIHNKTGHDPFKNEDWLSYGTIQGWKNRDWSFIYKGMIKNRHQDKPLYAQEVFWPGNIYHGEIIESDIRKKGFVLFMAAAAINYADMHGNSSSGFSGTLDFSLKVQSKHDIIKKVWDFFETIEFYKMKPCSDLVNNGFCLAKPGEEYLILIFYVLFLISI